MGASFVHLPLKNGTYHTSLLRRLHFPVLESEWEKGERTGSDIDVFFSITLNRANSVTDYSTVYTSPYFWSGK